MTTATMDNPITDKKFAALKAKLRELFELDKSDLDFGIYRIMAAKNKEVTDFLDRQLKDVVRETLSNHGAAATEQIQAEIEEAKNAAKAAGFNPDDSPKVQELQAKLDSAGGSAAAELEADIYNHLLTFFSRYYDEGDFIAQRRYKGDTYAIPYSGEEVKLHWANKDQYYVKSGEWHKDYRFRVPGHSDKAVRFKLVEATQEANNNKEADDAKRRYILDADNPVEVNGTSGGELTLYFQFRVPTDEEKQQVKDSEATRIFGGKYDRSGGSGRTQGDEREQFCADAEKRALDSLPLDWAKLIAAPASAATDSKPNRTTLGRHLDEFTARNTFDYFIHKDLGGFLRRELDFYIKNEVLRLDDLEALAENHLARVQGKVKAIRRVAGRIIDFLASVEEFQKKLWLKKKFVLETNWLVTIDRIPESLRDTVAANQDQWDEWEKLGFRPDETESGGLFHGAKWGTREYLDANDKLVVDTRFFDGEFKAELLASEEVLHGHATIEDAMAGILANGENYQTLSLLQDRYTGLIDCTYADPPYNTGGDGFLYRDRYQHSSWLAFVSQVTEKSQRLSSTESAFFISIDENELENLMHAVGGVYIWAGTIVVQNNPKGRFMDRHLSTSHEYLLSYTLSATHQLAGIPKSDSQIASDFPEQDEKGRYRLLELRNTHRDFGKHNRPNLFYPFYCDPSTGSLSLERMSDNQQELWPIWNDGFEGCWTWSKELAANQLNGLVAKQVNGAWKVFRKAYADDAAFEKPKTIWDEREVQTEVGQATITSMFGHVAFKSPKPTRLIEKAIWLSSKDVQCVLDCYAGSGTTGHAVLKMNREDGLDRQFLLAEMGPYFDSVLKPRIEKALYSPEWSDGKARCHDQGMSALVKYFAVESYEDALNNLPAPDGSLYAEADEATKDALITYSLDLELGRICSISTCSPIRGGTRSTRSRRAPT